MSLDESKLTKIQRIGLTGWQGGTAGFRVGAESRSRVLEPYKRTLRRVQVELPGHGTRPCCRIRATFWTTCPELRSAEIGRWMEQRGDKPWPQGKPPRYEAELITTVNDTATVRIVR